MLGQASVESLKRDMCDPSEIQAAREVLGLAQKDPTGNPKRKQTGAVGVGSSDLSGHVEQLL